MKDNEEKMKNLNYLDVLLFFFLIDTFDILFCFVINKSSMYIYKNIFTYKQPTLIFATTRIM